MPVAGVFQFESIDVEEVTVFTQECPVCGRPLKIRSEYRGRVLTCRHCRGRLLAGVPTKHARAKRGLNAGLMQRADELLCRVAGSKAVAFSRSAAEG